MGLVRRLTGLTHPVAHMSRAHICLVLGGTGLLGKALAAVVKDLVPHTGDLDGYHFVFVGSREADLR